MIGPRLLVPFRVHHVNPEDMLRRGFLEANGEVAALTVPVLLVLLNVPLNERSAALGVFGLGLCGTGMFTNQIHQWAHMAAPPRAVRMLQTLRVLLRPEDHAGHHCGRYDAYYCITTGWCNRPLEAVSFFRHLERATTRFTDATPRYDEDAFLAQHTDIVRR